MKKIVLAVCAASILAASAFSQVMQNAGVENTAYTGFGSPVFDDPLYFGVIDCLQARVDVGHFTLEGMVNWGALAYSDNDGNVDNFSFRNTPRNALSYLYSANDGYGVNNVGNSLSAAEVLAAQANTKIANPSNAVNTTFARQDDYYVNFLWHPAGIEGLDVGMGTKLNWQVGPAPRYGSWLWEYDAHVRQGGFSTAYDDRSGSVNGYGVAQDYRFVPDAPGSADVVGFVHYANKYAKKAIGIRYSYDDDFKFQVGGAIPDGADTDHPRANVGATLGFDVFTLSLAYEGLFQRDGNLYAGANFSVKQFMFDVYFAWDNIDNDGDDNDDMSNSIGAAMTLYFEKPGITIRPEGSLNWFENTHYTPAWYVGGSIWWDLTEKISLGAWSSFAVGSMDNRWDDDDETDDWGTGTIFDIRPELVWHVAERHTVSAYFDLQNRVAFDRTNRNCWATGLYWTYKLDTSASKGKKRK